MGPARSSLWQDCGRALVARAGLGPPQKQDRGFEKREHWEPPWDFDQRF